MQKIYTVLKPQALESGVVAFVARGNQAMEALIRHGMVIQASSAVAPIEKVVAALAFNSILEVKVTPTEIALEKLNPVVVAGTFAASAPQLFEPSPTLDARLTEMLQVMGYIAKLGEGPGRAAVEAMAGEFRKRYPTFSLDSGILRPRWKAFRGEHGVAASPLAEAMPDAQLAAVGWAVDNATKLEKGPVRDAFLRHVFLGTPSESLLKATLKKEGGLGAKPGAVRLSKDVYGVKAGASTVVELFTGDKKAGELPVTWASDKKPEAFLTKGDLEKLKLTDGQSINLVFKH